MTKLEQARKKINEIDEKMAKLFEERMMATKDVALFKKENALPILDITREKELLLKNSNYIIDSTIREYYVNFLQSVMEISKKYQFRLLEGQKVAYCGAEGAFGYIAAKKMFNNATFMSFKNFDETYHAVENGICDVAILPIENSYAGDVGTVMDLIFSGSLFINQIFDLDVVHNLIGTIDASIDTIKTVYSHPQALSQCSSYLKKHNFEEIAYGNTALAAKEIAELNDNTIASIASADTAELYGLKVIESNINTSRNNTTRFVALSRCQNLPNSFAKMGEHFILVFTVKNEAGALANTLNIIGAHGFNMRTLRSRPMKELLWNYYFYVELDGNINTEDGKDMLVQLKTVCDRLKLVGTYHSSKM